VYEYDAWVQRSNPFGLLVRFEVNGRKELIDRMEFGLDDGEDPFTYKITSHDPTTKRGEAWKPVINGTWKMIIKVYSSNGKLQAYTVCPGVTVTF
jgi:hypothetical protein